MNRLYCIFSIFALFAAGLLSCTKEGVGSGVESVEGCVQISINIPSDPAMKSSSDEGALDERTINSLHVYAFMGGELVGYHSQTSSVKTNFLLDMSMDMSEDKSAVRTIDFYVVANEAAMVMEQDMPVVGETLTEAQLNALRFIAIAPNAGLPMCYKESRQINILEYGDMASLSPELKQGHEGMPLLREKLTFSLVRTIGKITLSVKKASASVPDVFIKSVSMLARGTRHYNYLMPQDEDFLKTLSPRVNDRAILSEGAEYVVSSTELEEVATAYCSENPYGSPAWNIPNTDNSVVLRAEYSIGEGTELRNSYIYLPKVERNKWIKINCIARGEGTISVEYKVKDWNLATEDDEYIVFDYPTHTYLLPELPTSEFPVPDFTDVNGDVIEPVMSPAKPFVGYFQILHPAGQRWHPTFVRIQDGGDAIASDFTTSVYEVASDGTETFVAENDGYGLNTGTNTYFKICITPEDQGTVGAKLHLGITTMLQGFGYTEYLLINGSQSELYWPSDGVEHSGGTDPNVLIITQIEENQ